MLTVIKCYYVQYLVYSSQGPQHFIIHILLIGKPKLERLSSYPVSLSVSCKAGIQTQKVRTHSLNHL